MKIPNYFLLTFLLGAQLYGSEGIQNGVEISSHEVMSVHYIGSMHIPDLKNPHRCTTLLVNEGVAITAGHCLVYETRQSIVEEIDFDWTIGYVRMGALEHDRGQRKQIEKGVLHSKFSKMYYTGIFAAYNLGALKLRQRFTLLKNVIEVLDFQMPEETRYHLLNLDKPLSERCRIQGWGAKTVLPLLESDFCNSVSCRDEIMSRCHYMPNPKMKMVEVMMAKPNFCVEQYHPIGKDQADDLRLKQELSRALNQSLAYCHVPKRQTKNESITIGDEGAPLLCTDDRKLVFAGMNIGGRIAHRTDENKIMMPAFYLTFDVVQSFMIEVDMIVYGSSPPKNICSFFFLLFVSFFVVSS